MVRKGSYAGADRKRRYDRAHAVTSGDHPGGKAASIGKPAHHLPDAADIDDPGTDTADQSIAHICGAADQSRDAAGDITPRVPPAAER